MTGKTYIFIDESGDLGRQGTEYFIMVAVVVEDFAPLRRIIKRIRQRKLKKKMRDLPELKGNNCNKEIRMAVLKKVAEIDCDIYCIVLKKDLLQANHFEKKNKMYNDICKTLLEDMDVDGKSIQITIDKKDTNTLTRQDFDQHMQKYLPHQTISIEHKQSHLSNELQVVDFIAWSIQRKFNHEDEEYFILIEKKVSIKQVAL